MLGNLIRLRVVRFGLVGASGVVVNTLVLALLTSAAGLFYVASALLATEVSIAWNFALSERWVFQGRRDGGRLRRFVSFTVVNSLAFGLSGPLLWVLVSGIGLHYLVGNLLSIGGLMVVRFLVADKLIWGAGRPLGRLLDLVAAGGPSGRVGDTRAPA
jgi:dolichol-phosphate mannosyltransferase